MKATRRLPLGEELERGPEVTVTGDGRRRTASLGGRAVTGTVRAGPTPACRGESVAALLFAEGNARTRTTVGGEPRGVFCGMGVRFDCLVVGDHVPNTRACRTPGR